MCFLFFKIIGHIYVISWRLEDGVEGGGDVVLLFEEDCRGAVGVPFDYLSVGAYENVGGVADGAVDGRRLIVHDYGVDIVEVVALDHVFP